MDVVSNQQARRLWTQRLFDSCYRRSRLPPCKTMNYVSVDLITSRNSRSLSLVRSRVARQWMRLASRRDIRRTLSMDPAAPPDDARAPAWEDDALPSPSAPSPSPEAEGWLDIELHWRSIAQDTEKKYGWSEGVVCVLIRGKCACLSVVVRLKEIVHNKVTRFALSRGLCVLLYLNHSSHRSNSSSVDPTRQSNECGTRYRGPNTRCRFI